MSCSICNIFQIFFTSSTLHFLILLFVTTCNSLIVSPVCYLFQLVNDKYNLCNLTTSDFIPELLIIFDFNIDSGHYIASINCCKKHYIATITKLRSLELPIKTPLLHILYYINGLTHDFWTRTGGWEFDRSHGAGTSSPSHWQQVEE